MSYSEVSNNVGHNTMLDSS